MDWTKNFVSDDLNQLWIDVLERNGAPTLCRGVHVVSYPEVLGHLESGNIDAIRSLIERLALGDLILMREAFSLDEIAFIRQKAETMREEHESSFYKMKEGCPDFWRDITEELSSNYAIPLVKRSCYWFPWNKDNIFDVVYPRWRVLRLLGGRHPKQFEGWTPKQGKCDRIQVVEYPSGSGFLAPHQDPKHNQRIIMSAYMTKKPVDFLNGGFWAKMSNGEELDVEGLTEVGDIGICYADIVHGVKKISGDGQGPDSCGARWFLGLYTNDSDEIDDRITVRSA